MADGLLISLTCDSLMSGEGGNVVPLWNALPANRNQQKPIMCHAGRGNTSVIVDLVDKVTLALG